MKKLTDKFVSFTAALLLTGGLITLPGAEAQAVAIGYDEIIYDTSDGPVDASLLSGTVDMTYIGGVATFTVTNTTAVGATSSFVGNTLSGVGFVLPDNIAIDGGSANMGSSLAHLFTKPGDGDISEEWGYAPNGGSGVTSVNDVTTLGDINAVFSSRVASSDSKFAAGSLDATPGLGGPDFGLFSSFVGLVGGFEVVIDTMVITLDLSGTGLVGLNEQSLAAFLNEQHLVLMFGSPSDSTGCCEQEIPEPGTLAVFGAGLIGLAIVRRRRKAVA